MDWMILLKKAIQLMIQYFNMSFTFGGHKITVSAVIIFVSLVSLVIYILRGMLS